jgi:hypothetical protein
VDGFGSMSWRGFSAVPSAMILFLRRATIEGRGDEQAKWIRLQI